MDDENIIDETMCEVCGCTKATRRRECVHVLCTPCYLLSPVCCMPKCSAIGYEKCEEQECNLDGFMFCSKCNINIPDGLMCMSECPHSIWTQMANFEMDNEPQTMKTPKQINGRDVILCNVSSPVVCGRDFKLEKDSDDMTVVAWCRRNLIVKFSNSVSVKLYRGSTNMKLGIPWPSDIMVFAPTILSSCIKSSPCQVVSGILDGKMSDQVLFSADFQWMVSPMISKFYRRQPLIGSRVLDTQPSVSVFMNGIQCNNCMRLWQACPEQASKFIHTCGTKGMIEGHLHAAIRVCSTAFPSFKTPSSASPLKIDTIKEIVSTNDNIKRFGIIFNNGVIPEGCIATLARKGCPTAIALFISPAHRESVTVMAASNEDLATWFSVVTNSSNWDTKNNDNTQTSIDGNWIICRPKTSNWTRLIVSTVFTAIQ